MDIAKKEDQPDTEPHHLTADELESLGASFRREPIVAVRQVDDGVRISEHEGNRQRHQEWQHHGDAEEEVDVRLTPHEAVGDAGNPEMGGDQVGHAIACVPDEYRTQ